MDASEAADVGLEGHADGGRVFVRRLQRRRILEQSLAEALALVVVEVDLGAVGQFVLADAVGVRDFGVQDFVGDVEELFFHISHDLHLTISIIALRCVFDVGVVAQVVNLNELVAIYHLVVVWVWLVRVDGCEFLFEGEPRLNLHIFLRCQVIEEVLG